MELVDGTGSASERKAFSSGRVPAKSLWIPALVSVAVLVLDQVTKGLIRDWIGPGAPRHRFDLVGRLLAFNYVENRGAAFGILQGQTAFLILAASAIVVLLVLTLRDAGRLSPMMYLGVGLLLGGALGNLIDRIRLGSVTDFIAVGIWPKFNVADSAISVGLVLMGLGYLVLEPSRITEGRQAGRHGEHDHSSV